MTCPHVQGVAGTTGGTVWYVNWRERDKARLVSGHAGHVTGAAFSPDGLYLATACLDGGVAVWSAATMEQILVFQTHQKQVQHQSKVCPHAHFICAYKCVLDIH